MQVGAGPESPRLVHANGSQTRGTQPEWAGEDLYVQVEGGPVAPLLEGSAGIRKCKWESARRGLVGTCKCRWEPAPRPSGPLGT